MLLEKNTVHEQANTPNSAIMANITTALYWYLYQLEAELRSNGGGFIHFKSPQDHFIFPLSPHRFVWPD